MGTEPPDRSSFAGVSARQSGINAGSQQFLVRQLCDRLHAIGQIAAKFFDIPCAGEATGHADHGNRALVCQII